MTQKKRDSAKVAHSTIISVIILMYSFVRISISDSIMKDSLSCKTGDKRTGGSDQGQTSAGGQMSLMITRGPSMLRGKMSIYLGPS